MKTLTCLMTLCLAAATAALAGPPATKAAAARRSAVVDHAFGLTIADPYRWMEGEKNAEFDAWLKAQGTASRAKLDALPTLHAWRERLARVAGVATVQRSHRLVGERLFFLRAPAGKEGILMARESDGREHTVFDPNAEDGGASVSNYSPSPDGGRVTINITRGGNEIGEIGLFDVASGKRLADTLKPVWSEFNPDWLPDGSGFFYTRMRDVAAEDADPMRGMGAYLHLLGRPQAEDRLVAKAGAADALHIAENDFPSVGLTPGSRWAVLQIGGARASGRACVAPLADAIAGRADWRCVVDDPDNVQGATVHGGTLYLLSAKDAPNRRVLALDLDDPDARLADARVVVAERADTVLSDVEAARDGLYVKSMRHGLDAVERVDYASGERRALALPYAGSVYLLRTDTRQDGALLSLEGWTSPRAVYRYDPAANKLIDTGLGMLDAPAYPDLVAEEIEATSADGTRVPMSVVRAKQMTMDGSARAIVDGYGGYGYSIQPAFDPPTLEWSKAGGVYAACHVRGGGENGDAWRLGGAGANKQRGVEDFIACAQELAKRGYTSPRRTAGFGASMGGVLTGGAYVTKPDAWGAMIVQSGIFDPVRLLAAKNGANQIGEMGDPHTAGGLKQLLAMDPYQRVRDGVRYPPLLLVTGAVDQRVAPWNSGKFGARVMAASPLTPVWYRTDEAFGHFATNANAHALEQADIYAFAEAQLQDAAARK